MDLQKEREAFEEWYENHKPVLLVENIVKGTARAAWQAAQAQAIPEGFVLVPKEPTRQIYRTFYDAFNSANAGNTAQCFKVAYKSMIEAAQEPAK